MPDLSDRIQALYEEKAPAVSISEIQTIEVGQSPRAAWARPVLAVASLILVVAIGGLVLDLGSEPSAGDELIRVHTGPGTGGMDAIVTGVVEIDLELGCVWLSDPGGARYPVVWPSGTRASLDPFELTFANGLTARAGDRVTGGGGYVNAASAVSDPFPDACLQTGDAAVFNAGSDIEVEPGVGNEQPTTLFGRFSVPEVIGFELISVNPNARSVAVTDFVTGTIHLFDAADYPSPADAISGASGGGGFIHIWADGTIYSYPGVLADIYEGEIDADPVVYQPDPLIRHEGIAPTLEVVPATDGERVWLVQPGVNDTATTIELVNLVEVQVTRLGSWEIEGTWHPAGTTVDGLVLNSDSDRVQVVGFDGTTIGEVDGRAISVGWQSIGIIGGDGELSVTDAFLGNPVAVQRPGRGIWVGVGGPIIPSEAPPVVTGQERLLVGQSENDTVGIYILDTSGATQHIYDGTPNAIASWTRAGDWVSVVENGSVALIKAETGEIHDLGEMIPPDHWVLTAG